MIGAVVLELLVEGLGLAALVLILLCEALQGGAGDVGGW